MGRRSLRMLQGESLHVVATIESLYCVERCLDICYDAAAFPSSTSLSAYVTNMQ
jgi:hypothetical protein